MKIIITGASGFVGRQVVVAALQRGHHVRALVRPFSRLEDLAWRNDSSVELIRADLRSKVGLIDVMPGVDSVLHLALNKQGDGLGYLAATVIGTENLLEAMLHAGVRRFVLVSSFSVYNYLNLRSGRYLDESCAVESEPERRDYYCMTKLLQEQLVRDAEREGIQFTIVRPGAIFGKGNPWTDRLGMDLSPRTWIRMGGYARLPLTYVENCAEAIVMCAETDAAMGKTLNIVDDETPNQRSFARLLQHHWEPRPCIVPVPWPVVRMVARLASGTNKLLFRGKVRLPQILRPPSVHARFKPLRYTNQALKQTVGWRPRYSLEEALKRCLEGISGFPK